jgi:hypothetical protein
MVTRQERTGMGRRIAVSLFVRHWEILTVQTHGAKRQEFMVQSLKSEAKNRGFNTEDTE